MRITDELIHVFGTEGSNEYRLVGDSDMGLRGTLIAPEGDVGTYTLRFNSVNGVPREKEFEAVTDFLVGSSLAITYLQGMARGGQAGHPW